MLAEVYMPDFNLPLLTIIFLILIILSIFIYHLLLTYQNKYSFLFYFFYYKSYFIAQQKKAINIKNKVFALHNIIRVNFTKNCIYILVHMQRNINENGQTLQQTQNKKSVEKNLSTLQQNQNNLSCQDHNKKSIILQVIQQNNNISIISSFSQSNSTTHKSLQQIKQQIEPYSYNQNTQIINKIVSGNSSKTDQNDQEYDYKISDFNLEEQQKNNVLPNSIADGESNKNIIEQDNRENYKINQRGFTQDKLNATLPNNQTDKLSIQEKVVKVLTIAGSSQNNQAFKKKDTKIFQKKSQYSQPQDYQKKSWTTQPLQISYQQQQIQVQLLQYDSQVGSQQYYSTNQITKYLQNLQEFNESYVNPNSFRNLFQQLTVLIQNYEDQDLILSKNTFKFLFNRFKHLKLNKIQQKMLLSIILDLVQVNQGVKIDSLQIYQPQYCQKISQKLHSFQNHVYYKTRQNIKKNNNKEQYSNILYPNLIKMKQQIIKILKIKINQKIKGRRKIEKIQCQMRFYRNYYQFQRAKQVAEEISKKTQILDEQIFQKGNVLLKNSLYDEALTQFQYYLQILQNKQNHKQIPKVLHQIGKTYYYQQNFDKSLQFYQRCLLFKKSIYGQNSSSYSATINNIGLVYKQLLNYQKALECYQKSLSIQQKLQGVNYIDLARTLGNIGVIHRELANYDKALQYYQRAVQIQQDGYGKDSIKSLVVLNNIANIYILTKKFDLALKYFNKCLQILKRTYNGKDVEDTSMIYHNIAWLYEEQGIIKQAVVYMKKSYDIRCEILGQDHLFTKDSQVKYQQYLSILEMEEQQKLMRDLSQQID